MSSCSRRRDENEKEDEADADDAQGAVALVVSDDGAAARQYERERPDRLGRRSPESVRADSGQAGDQAVGRGVGDQVLLRTPATLRGNGQRAIFDEATGVDQIGDVLPRGPATLVVPLGNSGLPTFVEGE